MYLCITCVQHPGRPGEDARSLELELQTGVSHHMVLRAEPRSSARTTSAQLFLQPLPFKLLHLGESICESVLSM